MDTEIEVTPAFGLYWKFAFNRHDIYERRIRGEPPPWTEDPILREFKFTCPFRAADRTSQYLIKEVIYEGGSMEPEEVVFRTFLFKLFNKIQTWQLLTSAFGPLTWKKFDRDAFGAVLSEAKARGVKIFTGAYMQRPQTGFDTDDQGKEIKEKHNRYLRMFDWLMRIRITKRLQEATHYRQAYQVLRDLHCPAIGPFAAMQWITDLNYSPVMNFDEDSHIVPGRGAMDGIMKCFSGLTLQESDVRDQWVGALVIEDCVRKQDEYFAENGLESITLFGQRKLTAIDCQNIFCETDKYCRKAMPQLNKERVQIKSTFTPTGPLPKPFFPPKWGIKVPN